MNNFVKNNEGVSLVLVLIIIASVGVLITAFVNSSIFNIKFSSNQVQRSRAYYAAKAGIHHLKSDLPYYYNNFEADEDVLTDESLDYSTKTATYDVSVYSVDYSANYKIFKSTGNYDGEYNLYFKVENLGGLGDFGVFTAEEILLGGSANINDGDIYTEIINYRGNSEKKFDHLDIFTQEDGFEFMFPINEELFTNDTYNQSFGTINSNETITVNDGEKIYIDEINLSGNNSTLNIVGPTGEDNFAEVDIYVANGFDISGNAELNFLNNINASLYVQDSFDLDGGGNSQSINTVNKETTLITYIHPDIENIELSGNIDGDTLFYAPKTNFKLTGSAEIFGAIIAKEIDGTGNFTISYNQNLEKFQELFNEAMGGSNNFATIWSE